MADGIHVFNLPERVTDKQLKVYFSNPRNGGGHIRKILHPLPHDSAIILFDNPRTVRDILQKHHVLREQRLSVRPLPKRIFGMTKVELEKSISQYIERNPNVVDELQYVGDLGVDFHYEKEIYILKGNWYQLEWALHYLDSLLDESDLETKDKNKAREKEWRNLRKEYGELDEDFVVPEPKKHEIKRPNIPMVNKAQGFARNYGGVDKSKVAERKKETESSSRYASKTMRQNLDESRESKVDNGNSKIFKSFAKADRNTLSHRQDDSGSDDENYGAYYTARDLMGQYGVTYGTDKAVTFTNDTDFSENKPRPARIAPRRTKGIDVAQTDFGEVPLAHEFVMPNDLKVKVLMDDISKQSTDGIINPTSPDLTSIFGASRAIVQAGGVQIQREMQEYVKKNGNLGWAEVCHTKPGGTLNKNVVSVIHTVSPGWNEENSEEATHYLVCTYINCLTYADSKLWLKTIATPVISSGNFGFPLDVCIQAFYDAILMFSTHGQANKHLKEVHLVCFDQDTSVAAIVLLQSLFDCDTTQALSAATDRYNTRFLKSNFAAQNFSTDEVVGTETRGFKTRGDKQTLPSKQHRNKNATKNLKVDQGEDEILPRSNKADGVPRQNDGRFTNKGLLKGVGMKEHRRDADEFEPDQPRHVNSESSDEEAKDSRESRHKQTEVGVGKERKNYDEVETNMRSTKVPLSPVVDAKKSVQNIDRPRFYGDDEDIGDAGDFSVGIIGADQYFKKFEDLIVIEDKEDGEEEKVLKQKQLDNDEEVMKRDSNTEKKFDKDLMNDNKDEEEERSGSDNEENVEMNLKSGDSGKSEKRLEKDNIDDVLNSDDEGQSETKCDMKVSEIADITSKEDYDSDTENNPSLTVEDKEISADLDRELGFAVVSNAGEMKERLSESLNGRNESGADKIESSEIEDLED